LGYQIFFGNTCYLNASIQSLIPALCYIFRNFDTKGETAENLKIFLHNPSDGRKLVSYLAKKFPDFKITSHQNDSLLLVQHLLRAFKEEGDIDIVNSFYIERFYTAEQCHSCNRKLNNTPPSDIIIVSGINDDIQNQIKEKINHLILCKMCQAELELNYKLPNFLIVNYARDGKALQVNNRISVINTNYRLSSVVYHSGSYTGGGHNYAESMRNGDWYYFNDSSYNKKEIDCTLKYFPVLSAYVVMLIYAKEEIMSYSSGKPKNSNKEKEKKNKLFLEMFRESEVKLKYEMMIEIKTEVDEVKKEVNDLRIIFESMSDDRYRMQTIIKYTNIALGLGIGLGICGIGLVSYLILNNNNKL